MYKRQDVGNADPNALMVAVSAAQAVERLGMPEARIVLAQAVTYIAVSYTHLDVYKRQQQEISRLPIWMYMTVRFLRQQEHSIRILSIHSAVRLCLAIHMHIL